MRSFKPSFTVLLSLAAGSVAQSIAELLTSIPELKNLTTILSGFPDLVTTLSGSSNITILAPSNKAISDATKMMPTGMTNSTELIRSLLAYHALNGTYRVADFESGPKFLPTLLTDKKYANLSTGEHQVVKAIEMEDHASIYSGLNRVAMVTRADVSFTGGIVHIIDSVLTLPMNVSTTAIAANLTAAAGALVKTNLATTVDTLSSVTIFAPSNAAFQAIGSLVGGLSNEQLASIMTYHVVPSRAFSAGVTNNQKLRTVQGGELTIRINGGNIYVNGAKVIVPDVITNNGVVHVIDGVLNPNATNDKPDTSASTQSPAFPSATSSPDVPFTSGVPTPTGFGISTSSHSASASSTGTSQPNAAVSVTGNVVIAVIGAALAFAAGMMV